MGVRYCGDSERRELFEKWRRPPKAEGRSDGGRPGGTALPREGRTAGGRRRAEEPSLLMAASGRESRAAERGMAERRAVGRRAGCKYVRKTIIIVAVERGRESGGVGAFSRPTDDDVTQYTFEILMNWQLRLLKNGFFGPLLLFLSHSLS